ncbi:type III-A CRISPR-associated RAMP protein Csm5 [Veillonella magna]|uniref:type III-A CRISPR-associated RAMP protein Csm5 n=1 Tax=Veillonella magna TaxID=464322 RepID=UPI0023F42315|nr:type III-A CRISPR-associated RAMP protein Csm5 [Veillonella magna]MBD8975638.1 type III-A CRISPR-associated RAMP protein Csm5 [Veillonella magna]
MMNKINCYTHKRMTLRIVSPTTVADSRVLSPQEYIYDNHSRMLYVLNDTQWFCYLQKKGLLRDFENKCVKPRLNAIPLYEWLEEKLHRRGFDVESELGTAVKYKIPAESKPTKEKGNRLNQVVLCMRLCDGRVYIPGSTIKGVIRTAILFKLLEEHDVLRQKWYREIRECIQSYQRNIKQLEKELKSKLFNIEKQLVRTLNFGDQKANDVLRDAMRGIRCSDAMPQGTISTRVVQKIDFKLKEGAYNTLPIYKEMIEPGATFSFTITLEPSMTKTIGVESVEDIIECLLNWFEAVLDPVYTCFGNHFAELFDNADLANCIIGGNTNFLYKTLYVALADEGKSRDLVKYILNTQFRKHAHLTDNIISPRTLKGTSMNGTFYMTGEAEIQIEK